MLCQANCKASAKKGSDAVTSSATSTSHTQSQWDPDDYMNSYDSDDYDDSTYFELQSKRGSTKQQAQKRLFNTAADRRLLEAQGQRTVRQILFDCWCSNAPCLYIQPPDSA